MMTVTMTIPKTYYFSENYNDKNSKKKLGITMQMKQIEQDSNDDDYDDKTMKIKSVIQMNIANF